MQQAQGQGLPAGGHHLRRRDERLETGAANSQENVTRIIHGKARHEETKATSSQRPR